MSNVLITKNGKLEYLQSVNTPDYSDAVVNPDISAVKDVPKKYWKIVGQSVVEMTKAEKKIVDDAEIAENDAKKQTLNHLSVKQLAKALIAKGLITKAEILAEE